MDTKIDTKLLIKEASARFKHAESKIYLQEKYKSQLTVAHHGGLWEITPQLLAFLRTSPQYTIATDVYGNPVKIETAKLLGDAEVLYDRIMNSWLEEYTELQSNR